MGLRDEGDGIVWGGKRDVGGIESGLGYGRRGVDVGVIIGGDFDLRMG